MTSIWFRILLRGPPGYEDRRAPSASPTCVLPLSAALLSCMARKTTFVCDCCHREADDNVGWAHVHVNGATGGKQLMPDEDRDLCEICWSPLQTLMKTVQDETRGKRNSSDTA